jgi:hypothetical protein
VKIPRGLAVAEAVLQAKYAMMLPLSCTRILQLQLLIHKLLQWICMMIFVQPQLEAKRMLHWLAGPPVLSVPAGGSRSGAVDIIRVSGSEAVQIAQRVFWPQVKPRQSMTAQPCYVA